MGLAVDCCGCFCLFVREAVMTAPDLGTLVATGSKAIVETIQPVSDPFVQTGNSAIAQTIDSVRETWCGKGVELFGAAFEQTCALKEAQSIALKRIWEHVCTLDFLEVILLMAHFS
jgi:hypothetical protein